MSSSRGNTDSAELNDDKDKERQEKKILLQTQEAAENEENDSSHVDIKA